MSVTKVNLKKDDTAFRIILVPSEERKPPVLDHGVLDQLDGILNRLEVELKTENSPRVVILESSSPRFFCAGANIAMLSTLDAQTMESWVERGHEVFAKLEMLPVPTIAVVTGYALGGGLELALACDLIFTNDSAQFGQTEVRLGFVTGWGGGRRLTERVGMARAKELSFSGRIINSTAAFRIGLTQFTGSDDDLSHHIKLVVDDIGKGAPEALAAMKEIIGSASMTDFPSAKTGVSAAEMRNLELERAHSVSLVESTETKRRVREFIGGR